MPGVCLSVCLLATLCKNYFTKTLPSVVQEEVILYFGSHPDQGIF